MLNRRRVGRETHREYRCWLPRGWRKCDLVTSTLILGWWLYPCSEGQQKTFNREPTYVSVNLQSRIQLLLPGSVPKEKGKPLPPKKKSSFSVLNFPFPKLQKIWSLSHCSYSSRPPATSPLEQPSPWTRTAWLLRLWLPPFSCLFLQYLQSILYLDVYVKQILNWGVPRSPSKTVFLPHSTFIWTLLKHPSAISKLTVPPSISGLGFFLEFQNHLPDWFPGISTCTS